MRPRAGFWFWVRAPATRASFEGEAHKERPVVGAKPAALPSLGCSVIAPVLDRSRSEADHLDEFAGVAQLVELPDIGENVVGSSPTVCD